MKPAFFALALFAGLVWWMLHGEPQYDDTELARLVLDDTRQLSPSVEDVPAEIDREISSDGRGSLRIDATEPTFVELARIHGKGEDLSFRQLLYEAKVKTEGVNGPVFLVMQAGITADGMPVVGNENSISGTNDWTTLQVAAGNPGNVKHVATTTLQLEIGGPGTVWIDDVRLVSRRAY